MAYDVPGQRSVLRQIDAALLAPEGDVAGLVSRTVRLIRLSQPAYEALQQRCVAVAAPYTWERIATQHLEVYTDALERVRATGAAPRAKARR